MNGIATLAINVFAVPDPDDKDNQLIVHYPADDPEISYSISPEFPEPGALKEFPDAAGIFQFRNSLLEEL
jgi:hypothetical protein